LGLGTGGKKGGGYSPFLEIPPLFWGSNKHFARRILGSPHWGKNGSSNGEFSLGWGLLLKPLVKGCGHLTGGLTLTIENTLGKGGRIVVANRFVHTVA